MDDDDEFRLPMEILGSELKDLEKLNSDRRESDITMSLSDYELQRIKEEVEAGLRDFEEEENLMASFFSSDQARPLDAPLTEAEYELLERCTIGAPGMFSQGPRASVGSASLDLLADSLIRDLDELDSLTRNTAVLEQQSLNATRQPAANVTVNSLSSSRSSGTLERTSGTKVPAQKEDEADVDFNQNRRSIEAMDASESMEFPGQNAVEYASTSAEVSEHDESRAESLDSDSAPASVDSGLPVRDVPAQHRYFVVVAIDFGTTFSGYAFSFTRDKESAIHMMRRWEGGDPGVSNQKTPTTLLLKPDGSFHSFGFGARDFYHDLEHEEAKKWMYFEKFKMTLHTDKVGPLEIVRKSRLELWITAGKVFRMISLALSNSAVTSSR